MQNHIDNNRFLCYPTVKGRNKMELTREILEKLTPSQQAAIKTLALEFEAANNKK